MKVDKQKILGYIPGAIAAVIGIAVFSSGWGLFAKALIGAVLAGAVWYVYFKAPEAKTSEEMQKAKGREIDDRIAELRKKISEKSAANGDYEEVVSILFKQVDSLYRKQKDLYDLIRLNDDNAKDYLISTSQGVRQSFASALRKFLTQLIAYNSKDPENRPSSIKEVPAIKKILENNSKQLKLYEKLIDTVTQMGDDVSIKDAGLASVIENIQAVCVTDDDEDEEEEPVLMSASSGSGKH